MKLNGPIEKINWLPTRLHYIFPLSPIRLQLIMHSNMHISKRSIKCTAQTLLAFKSLTLTN